MENKRRISIERKTDEYGGDDELTDVHVSDCWR